jgi:hypothetical protein
VYRDFRWLLVALLLVLPREDTALARGTRHIPVLAFYYNWYTPSTWCLCRMSDLPPDRYDSGSAATIDRQLRQASNAGINGFISSWWGQDDQTNHHFALLQSRAATLYRATGHRFTSTIYLESDSPLLGTQRTIVRALHYVLVQYARSPYFFHWHGKPVIFIWDPLGGGRTLAMWKRVRAQVDPHHRTIWSAEGTDINVLTVFDGLHLFSAANWALSDGSIAATDANFRARIDTFNATHHTHRIWAAGVVPGWNDMRVPGRRDAHIVPRHGGATYRRSWAAARASNPDWITITSFNEWFEGSMIEPSVRYGDRYLRITGEYASR